MKPYNEFVLRIYQLIIADYKGKNPIHYFCNGPLIDLRNASFDYVILDGKAANTFAAFAVNNLDLLGLSIYDLNAFIIPANTNKLKINISCYPRNLLRWMRGTISRKNKCRAEFCVLVWCHASGWDYTLSSYSQETKRIRKGLSDICNDYLYPDTVNDEMRFETLVKASNSAYWQSINKD